MDIHNIYIYTCWNLEKPSSEFLGNLERTVAQYMRDNDLPGKAVVLLEHDIMTDPSGWIHVEVLIHQKNQSRIFKRHTITIHGWREI